MALKDIAQRCWQVAEEKGFHEVDDTPPAWVANLHGEVNEFWEAYSSGKLDEQSDKGIPLTNAEEKLADLVIRAFDIAGQINFNIERAILVKLEYNASRPYLRRGLL